MGSESARLSSHKEHTSSPAQRAEAQAARQRQRVEADKAAQSVSTRGQQQTDRGERHRGRQKRGKRKDRIWVGIRVGKFGRRSPNAAASAACQRPATAVQQCRGRAREEEAEEEEGVCE